MNATPPAAPCAGMLSTTVVACQCCSTTGRPKPIMSSPKDKLHEVQLPCLYTNTHTDVQPQTPFPLTVPLHRPHHQTQTTCLSTREHQQASSHARVVFQTETARSKFESERQLAFILLCCICGACSLAWLPLGLVFSTSDMVWGWGRLGLGEWAFVLQPTVHVQCVVSLLYFAQTGWVFITQV